MKRVLRVLVVVAVLVVITATTSQPAAAVSGNAQPPMIMPPPPAILGYHTVRPGEWLYCIGRAYGVDPWAIARVNVIINPNLVRPGTILAIPNEPAWLPPGRVCAAQFPIAGPPACICRTYHTVMPGETLYRLSLIYGVSMWRIAECNGLSNPDYVRAYQGLCIP